MYGIDLSTYQKDIDLSKGKDNFDFGIVKLTEGVGYIDKSAPYHLDSLTSLGKLIGVYHFCRPDLHKTIEEARKEVAWFVKNVKKNNLIGRSILCLDWETNTYGNTHLLRAMVDYIIDETAIAPFIYCNRSTLNEIISNDANIFKDCYLWFAYWPSSIVTDVGGGGIMPEDKALSIQYHIWQYSSTGKFPGFKSRVDLNKAAITKEQWISFATPVIFDGGESAEEEENLSREMEWAVTNGIFVGYGDDGKIHPERTVTRNQLAVVLKRYTDMIEKNNINNANGVFYPYQDTDSIE